MSDARHWVENATPAPPPALRARVLDVIARHPEWTMLPAAEALTRAGEVLLRATLEQRIESPRDVALDLLAADACVTWAFEAATDAPATIPAQALAAMRGIQEVAT